MEHHETVYSDVCILFELMKESELLTLLTLIKQTINQDAAGAQKLIITTQSNFGFPTGIICVGLDSVVHNIIKVANSYILKLIQCITFFSEEKLFSLNIHI